jgi:hypothetical protein
LSTHFGLQQVFVLAIPVSAVALFCALQLRAEANRQPHIPKTE